MMGDEPTVWITSRKLASGKRRYYLRWIDRSTGESGHKVIGNDKSVAMGERVNMLKAMSNGTFSEIRKTTWAAFIDNVVANQRPKNAVIYRRVLTDFARVVGVTDPAKVKPADILQYKLYRRDRKRVTVATQNKDLRYLRAAFNMGVELEYQARSPLDPPGGGRRKRSRFFQKESKHQHRILKPAEEDLLIEAAKTRFGFQMEAWVRFAFETWARLEEVTGLAWADIDLDGQSLVFRDTKSQEDRFVAIDGSPVLDDLRRLRLQLDLARGKGPFCWAKSTLSGRWKAILKDAGIQKATIHDIRRTGITRALLGGMPPVVVQKLAGHKDIATTMKFYCEVQKDDLRRAVKALRSAS